MQDFIMCGIHIREKYGFHESQRGPIGAPFDIDRPEMFIFCSEPILIPNDFITFE